MAILNDFLFNNYSILTKLIIATSTIVGLIHLKFYKTSNVKYFIWFLVYVTLFECLASYTRIVHENESLKAVEQYLKGTKFEKNYWVYNLFWNFLGTLFLSFYYSKILKTKSFKVIIKVVTAIFLVASMIYIGFHFDSFFNSSIIFLKISALSVIFISIVLYFIEMLRGENILTFYKSFNFYASAALFIWWLVTTPMVFYQIYFSKADWNFIFLRWHIYLAANFFMYSIFTFAFIWCRRENH